MCPNNEVQPPIMAGPSEPRGQSKSSFLGEEAAQTTLAISTTKHLVYLLVLDLFFFLFSFSSPLAWHLAIPKPLKTVSLVVSLVSTVWSFFRWEEVFGDLAYDAVTKGSRSQQWSPLGRTFGGSRAKDARMRRAVRRVSQLFVGGIGVIQFWWLLVSLMTTP